MPIFLAQACDERHRYVMHSACADASLRSRNDSRCDDISITVCVLQAGDCGHVAMAQSSTYVILSADEDYPDSESECQRV